MLRCKRWFFLVFVLAFLAACPHGAAAQGNFKRAPCFESTIYNQPGVPGTTPVGIMSGHPFRKQDGCVPFDLVMTWEEHYRQGLDSYDVRYVHHVPGALWYREDKKDFVLHANETLYSGYADVRAFKGAGKSCKDEEGGQCTAWEVFNTGQVHPTRNPFGGFQGVLFYGPATTITDPQIDVDADEKDVPAQLSTVSVARVFDNGNARWRPERTKIENAKLADWKYEEFVLAAVEKRPLTKVVTWNRDANPEESPTPTNGRLTLQFIFDPPCPEKLLVRTDRSNYRFSEETPGKVVIDAEVVDVGNFPTPFLEHVQWNVPAMAGAQVEVSHPGGKKHLARITYTGLPRKNSEFGPRKIEASVFLGSRCGHVKGRKEVKLFFPRDASNNPKGNEPNWYYYWQQTSAGHSTVADGNIRYGGSDAICATNKWWMGAFPLDRKNFGTDAKPAWALVGRSYILLCNFAKARALFPTTKGGRPNDNFYLESRLPFNQDSWEGIDTFGVVTLHELTHRKHWRDWWSDGGSHANGLYPEGGFYDRNGNGTRDSDEPLLDSDEDHIPDSQEPPFNEDPYYLNLKITPGNPKSYSIAGEDMTDEHVVTYVTSEDPATGWKTGSADIEDWAAPGKQWKDE